MSFIAGGASTCPPRSPRPRMWYLKWFKKYRQPSESPAPLGIPTYIPAGPLGFSPTPCPDVPPSGAFRLSEIQPVGLIWLWWQAQTTEGLPGSHLLTGEMGMGGSMCRVPRPGLLNMRTVPKVSVYSATVVKEAHDPDSTKRGMRAWGPLRHPKRANRSRLSKFPPRSKRVGRSRCGGARRPGTGGS